MIRDPQTRIDIAGGQRCIYLYLYTRSACQGQFHYVSTTGDFEWYFW